MANPARIAKKVAIALKKPEIRRRDAQEMAELLEARPDLRYLLFRRGYLITTNSNLDLGAYPFLDQWRRECLRESPDRNLTIAVHKDETLFSVRRADTAIVLVGHAYNPFTGEGDERRILEQLLDLWNESQEAFFEEVSQLTGIHVIAVDCPEGLFLVQDCSGLKPAYYGHVAREAYITSHPQLVGDVAPVTVDQSNDKLRSTRMYNIGNRYLPGDTTPFNELRRLSPNTYLQLTKSMFTVHRFYPTEDLEAATTAEEVGDIIKETADLLTASLEIATKKWARPAISLTGGTDSKTTLASAKGLYDKFHYYSFHSKDPEVVDAHGARKICDALGLEHSLHAIPGKNEDIADYESLRAIIDHNASYIKNMSDNEARKMMYMEKVDDFDVEIKSWVSETVRVFIERKYGLGMPQKLTPRHLSILQTRYFGAPRLLREAERRYARFIQKTDFGRLPRGYEAADLYHWEVLLGAWGATVISALDYVHPVTIPWNNRRLLDRFLQLPRELRKRDEAHRMIVEFRDPVINQQNVEVRNLYFHDYRIWLEKAYFLYRTLPRDLAARVKNFVGRA